MADRALVERAQQGDTDAYERLALEVTDRLFGVAHRILRDIDGARDALQQTLVAIWTDLPGLRDPDRFEVWSYRLVVRFSLAESRRHRRIGISVIPLVDDTPEPRDDIEAVAARDQLERAFLALTPEHRAVLVLHHYLGLPLPDVADALGIPYGTASSRMHRATEQLRASLDAGTRVLTPGGVRA